MKSKKEILWDNHISLEKLQRDKPTFAMNILNAMHDYAMQQVKKLNVPAVSQQRELFNAILDFSEDLPMCTEDYHRSELWEKYKALNCG